jgi:hypothetical protein
LDIVTSRSIPRGTYQMTIKGTSGAASGSFVHTAGVSLRVR